MSSDPAAAVRAARSWVAHLRSGGTTAWADWLDHPGAAGASDPDAGPLPGAVQLELVRRLAIRRSEGGVDLTELAFGALADRALHRSAPGRGQPDAPLTGSRRDLAVGAPAMDPAAVPVAELVRLGIGLLADLVIDVGPLAARPRPPRPWWARPRLHLAGAPVTVDALRAGLSAAGRLEGGRRPEVLLVAQPLDEHLSQVWSTRVQHGAPVRWETFAGRWARRDMLPPSADLPRIASFWADRVGPARVHVLVAPSSHDVADVLGLRRPPVAVTPSDVHLLSAEALDVLRRLNQVLNVRVLESDRVGLVRRARTLLPARPPRPLALPSTTRSWAERRAREVIEAIRSGGYPVHGDLDAIAPRHRGAVSPRRPEVLSVVLETCLGAAEATRGTGG